TEWRAFVVPRGADGQPDYGPAAIAAQAARLPAWRARLAAIDTSGWPAAALADKQLFEAEINGLDFNFRVLKPWARDPGFYAALAADWSDVPAHEGQYAEPFIDLFAYKWPLSRADDARLTAQLAAIPRRLATARTNLAGSNTRDLWVYGDRAFKEQAEMLAALADGALKMRTLDGMIAADMTGASPALRKAITTARAATLDFAGWVAAEAPKKTGPSGVGKADYSWHARNVMLVPYDWDAQVVLLQRELDRSLAGLRLEEARNRTLPPLPPLNDPAAHDARVATSQAKFSRFIAAAGLAEGTDWARAAIANQPMAYVPPEKRNFFDHVTAADPLPLMSHFIHWVDLARIRHAPNPSPMRAGAPLFNIYANRSEGFATSFEEVAMQAGLYDDNPRGRELVWIMIANRAARGLASLHVQANEIDLATAGKFHASWTPRGWSDANSKLVGFEQLLYARQPGYGPSYIIGKTELETLMAQASHAAELAGKPFDMADFFARFYAAGIMPVGLIGNEMRTTSPAK
ncbi:MAG: DUF885 family protein, partial [Sandarakinorhabdus sp.]|nr:DUF885 family protein [Sandarakinorhabdus sp.]